jgi:hypothetical protein
MSTINGQSNMVYRLVDDISSKDNAKKIVCIPFDQVPNSERIQDLFGRGPINLQKIVKCCMKQKVTKFEMSNKTSTIYDFAEFQLVCRKNGFVRNLHLLGKVSWHSGYITNSFSKN